MGSSPTRVGFFFVLLFFSFFFFWVFFFPFLFSFSVSYSGNYPIFFSISTFTGACYEFSIPLVLNLSSTSNLGNLPTSHPGETTGNCGAIGTSTQGSSTPCIVSECVTCVASTLGLFVVRVWYITCTVHRRRNRGY